MSKDRNKNWRQGDTICKHCNVTGPRSNITLYKCTVCGKQSCNFCSVSDGVHRKHAAVENDGEGTWLTWEEFWAQKPVIGKAARRVTSRPMSSRINIVNPPAKPRRSILPDLEKKT